MIGTYDGTSFTLTRPAVEASEYDGPPVGQRPPGHALETPCPEPEGGWQVVDPALTNGQALDRQARIADQLDGYSDLWLDQSINPSTSEQDMNDPAKLVLNVRVAGDVAAAERTLRETWGGALCVSQAQRTDAELNRIQRSLEGTPGMLGGSYGRDVVDLEVIYDDGSLKQDLDERYGEGVVRVHSALQPYDG